MKIDVAEDSLIQFYSADQTSASMNAIEVAAAPTKKEYTKAVSMSTKTVLTSSHPEAILPTTFAKNSTQKSSPTHTSNAEDSTKRTEKMELENSAQTPSTSGKQSAKERQSSVRKTKAQQKETTEARKKREQVQQDQLPAQAIQKITQLSAIPISLSTPAQSLLMQSLSPLVSNNNGNFRHEQPVSQVSSVELNQQKEPAKDLEEEALKSAAEPSSRTTVNQVSHSNAIMTEENLKQALDTRGLHKEVAEENEIRKEPEEQASVDSTSIKNINNGDKDLVLQVQKTPMQTEGEGNNTAAVNKAEQREAGDEFRFEIQEAIEDKADQLLQNDSKPLESTSKDHQTDEENKAAPSSKDIEHQKRNSEETTQGAVNIGTQAHKGSEEENQDKFGFELSEALPEKILGNESRSLKAAGSTTDDKKTEKETIDDSETRFVSSESTKTIDSKQQNNITVKPQDTKKISGGGKKEGGVVPVAIRKKAGIKFSKFLFFKFKIAQPEAQSLAAVLEKHALDIFGTSEEAYKKACKGFLRLIKVDL